LTDVGDHFLRSPILTEVGQQQQYPPIFFRWS
jgi:hypothetical protein